jgi:hypothetical protein
MAIFFFALLRDQRTSRIACTLTGLGARKYFPCGILDFFALSPDDRWPVVQIARPDQEHPHSVITIPVEGGTPIQLCLDICLPSWDVREGFLYVNFLGQHDKNSYALPLRRGSGIPKLSSTGIMEIENLKKEKTALVIPQIVDSAVSPSFYAYTVQTTHRNLYRILLQ